MKYHKIFLLIFLVLQLCHFWGSPQESFGQYHFDSWTTADGLPQNGIRGITQTPDGYVWSTTFDGLVRFDGVRFMTFNKSNTKGIINNRFSGIYCHQDGTLYAFSAESGTLTIYKNGVFNSYTDEQVPERYIESIAPYKGELGVLVVGGENYDRSWYFLRDGQFVYSETLDKITHTFEHVGINGARWILSKKNITEIHHDQSTVYDDRLDYLQYTRPILLDSKGGLWLGGFKLSYLKDGKVENFPAEQYGFPKNGNFHQFWEEEDGSVWFANGGLSGEGIGLVRYQDGKFSSFGKESGLSDSSIFAVFKDREGIIWLATNKGLNRFRKQIIKTYNSQNGLSSSEVYPMLRDSKDQIWIGTTKGLTIYRDGKFEPVKLHQTDKNPPEWLKWKDKEVAVQSLWEDPNGKIWIGVGGALYVAENSNIRLINEGHHVYAIRHDRAGNVWAATNKGVLLFQDYQQKAFYAVAAGRPNEMMTTIYEDSQGRLWFGGFAGLFEFKDGKFINYTTKEGLTGNYVRSIYEDADGVLWIGTYGEGLSRFKYGQFVNYKAENGLFTNDVFAIQEDRRGNFWISSNRGIYRVNRQELNDFADKKIDKIHSIGYGKEDGMLNDECNGGRQPASLTDKDGNFWFPSQDGVVVVNSERETYNSLPPPVVIESATVEKKEVDISHGLSVKAGDRNIEINFTALSLIKSDQIKFKYKLEGHDEEWVDAGTRRTAYYSYLPPGNYQFLVKAANSEGIWNENGTKMDLIQQPFFYQTKSFYILCSAVGILSLFIIWRISVHQLVLRERKLERLVREKTDELHQLANSDGLTKIGNRHRFKQFLAEEWHRADLNKSQISLILLDIDHFKLYNDEYGHQAGDNCLEKVAKALAESVNSPTDLVARFGGEEFVIILGKSDSERALNIAEQVKENVGNLKIPHVKSLTSKYLTISIGVATIFANSGTTENQLIKAADDSLYRAKKTGRNKIELVDLTKDNSGENSLSLKVISGDSLTNKKETNDSAALTKKDFVLSNGSIAAAEMEEPIATKRKTINFQFSKVTGSKLFSIVFISTCLFVISVIAIPNLLSNRQSANEGAAISSLRTLHGAQLTFQATTGNGKYGTIEELSRNNLIDSLLGTGEKSGYKFNIKLVTEENNEVNFEITAEPITPEGFFATGTKSFYIGGEGLIYYNTGGQSGNRINPGTPLDNY